MVISLMMWSPWFRLVPHHGCGWGWGCELVNVPAECTARGFCRRSRTWAEEGLHMGLGAEQALVGQHSGNGPGVS